MRIGLISDTHIAWEHKELSPRVAEVFQGVDLILHAGDIYTHRVLDELGKVAPVLAALGDDDYPGPDLRIKEKHILDLGGKTLWLVHERPYSLLHPGVKLSKTSKEKEISDKPQIIIFGHEHRVVVEQSDGVLYVNSGSPTLLNYQRGPGTVALMEIIDGTVDVRVVRL